MIDYRTSKFVTYNDACQEHRMWLIYNPHVKLLNKHNTQLIPMVVENFSKEDFGSSRHSYRRAYLFKKNMSWDSLKFK